MHQSDILLKAIMDGGKHSIIVTDRHGTVTFVNHAAERLYGHEAAHFVGRPISALRQEIYDHDELVKEAEEMSREAGKPVALDEVFKVALDRSSSFERERTAVRRDGTTFHVLVSVTAMRDETGDTVGYLSISQDISERKRLERMKSEFISTVSHELRTPLTSIRGALGLMAGGAAGELPRAAADLVALAHRNSERLVRIINDILDMDKIESGRFAFDIRPFDAEEIVRQSLEENRAYGEKYGVRFVLTGMPRGLRVSADPNRVLQVLANLLSNAAKFSPEGSEVLVNVAVTGNSAVFSVRDFGQGVPESFRPHVFEKFAQSDKADVRENEGTGLGLSIARKMVEAMGGAIGFETETGKGTTFTFSLPRMAESAGTGRASATGGGADDGTGGARVAGEHRILICEDDVDVATLLKLLLGKAGFPADVAHSLAEARRRLRESAYAAMTLDLMLPDGDGLEFLGELRASTEWKTLPIVVISAKAEQGRRDAAAGSAGAVELVDWVSKPLDESTLLRSLEWASGKIRSETARILHVEDNEDLRKILHDLFKDRIECVSVGTLAGARALLKKEPFDLIVLDLGLPDGSGLDLLEEMDTFTGRPVPVLILSASELADKNIRKRVAAVLLKSRVSEERVVQTVLSLIRNRDSA